MSFGEAAKAKYALVDELSGGKPIISTQALKSQVDDIMKAFPKNSDGKPILTGDSIDELAQFNELPDAVTIEQAQSIRTLLFDKMDIDNPAAGISHRQASMLFKSLNKSFDDVAEGRIIPSVDNPDLAAQAIKQLQDAQSFYRQGIRQFDNATIKRILKEPFKSW